MNDPLTNPWCIKNLQAAELKKLRVNTPINITVDGQVICPEVAHLWQDYKNEHYEFDMSSV